MKREQRAPRVPATADTSATGASADLCHVALFTRAPAAGASKTRLIPALGAAAAARLHRCLTLRTLATVREAAIGPLTVWAAPDTSHRFFRALRSRCPLDLRRQDDGDLGQRMAAAFAFHQRPLILLGSDCPALRPAHLVSAARVLGDRGQQAVDAVFVPVEDGGYALVGLRRPQPRLFERIDWGGDRVMTQTRERLRELGLRWHETETLWDVDRPADLARLEAICRFR